MCSGVRDCTSMTATEMRYYSRTRYAGLDMPENKLLKMRGSYGCNNYVKFVRRSTKVNMMRSMQAKQAGAARERKSARRVRQRRLDAAAGKVGA